MFFRLLRYRVLVVALSVHVNFVAVLVIRIILRRHASVIERRILVVMTSRCELLRSTHLTLVEGCELLRGNHLKLAIGTDGISDVRYAIRRLHSHRVESWMHIHWWIAIRRIWRLPVPHHLRVHVLEAKQWRPIRSCHEEKELLSLLVRQRIQIRPKLLDVRLGFGVTIVLYVLLKILHVDVVKAS